MAEAAHQVLLRRDGAGFAVIVDPPHDAHPPRIFDGYREARGWAGGVRLTQGWALIDLAGDQPVKRCP